MISVRVANSIYPVEIPTCELLLNSSIFPGVRFEKIWEDCLKACATVLAIVPKQSHCTISQSDTGVHESNCSGGAPSQQFYFPGGHFKKIWEDDLKACANVVIIVHIRCSLYIDLHYI